MLPNRKGSFGRGAGGEVQRPAEGGVPKSPGVEHAEDSEDKRIAGHGPALPAPAGSGASVNADELGAFYQPNSPDMSNTRFDHALDCSAT